MDTSEASHKETLCDLYTQGGNFDENPLRLEAKPKAKPNKTLFHGARHCGARHWQELSEWICGVQPTFSAFLLHPTDFHARRNANKAHSTAPSNVQLPFLPAKAVK